VVIELNPRHIRDGHLWKWIASPPGHSCGPASPTAALQLRLQHIGVRGLAGPFAFLGNVEGEVCFVERTPCDRDLCRKRVREQWRKNASGAARQGSFWKGSKGRYCLNASNWISFNNSVCVPNSVSPAGNLFTVRM
jgi:hypothetical protein